MPPSELHVRVVELELAEPFVIASGGTDVPEVVVVELQWDGTVGRGEGSPVDYLGQTAADAAAWISEHGERALGADPWARDPIERRCALAPPAARCALIGAALDWVGRRLDTPVHRLLGVAPVTEPTSYTLGLDSVEGTKDRARRARDWPALKVKLGGPADLPRLQAIRAETSARIRVDCNGGWTLENALAAMPELVELGVELLEQPFPPEDRDSQKALMARSDRIPVLLDESCQDTRDLAGLADACDGVVIKLAKSGGLPEAVRMVHAARTLGLRTMLGCMVESELGIAQAVPLSAAVDWIDLDGHLLLAHSPYRGLGLVDGRVVPGPGPGLGVEPRA